MVMSGLSRGFGTCCLRFTNGVATIHARLASGWLARLCREGVQPSGPRQKVSVRLILLFWIYPGAREVSALRRSAVSIEGHSGLMLAARITLPHFLVSPDARSARRAC